MTDLLKQLTFEPIVEHAAQVSPARVVLGGMGGSALAAEAFAYLLPDRPMTIRRDYGLPKVLDHHALHIAISYSGTTEETVRFANEAVREGLPLAIVSSGGTLENLAEREGLPFVRVPAGLAPRNALIYMTRALLGVVGAGKALQALAQVVPDEAAITRDAEDDAHFILPSVPLFYSSAEHGLFARMAKLIMNETARTPAFSNEFPELNHNEMQSFDTDMPSGLEHLFRFVLIRSGADSERITRRMDAFTSLMEERGKMVHTIELPPERPAALVSTWLRLLSAGRMLAQTRDIDPDAQPLIDAFKKML